MEPTPHIWMNGRLVPWAEANVHVLTHGLHYGTGVFDSLRAYPTERGPAILAHRPHVERLVRSARLYGMELPYDVETLMEANRALVRDTGLDACYLRPIAYRGAGPLGVSPRGCPVDVAIAAWAWGAYLGDGAHERGIRAKVSSWQRIGHGALLPAAKATAHYLNSVLARQEAEEAGYDEAILLGADGLLAEGSGENLFVVADGRLVTPPLTSGALGGITRALVRELAVALGIPTEERPLARGDLYLADEVLLTGTAAELTPVREVDGRRIGDGTPGPVTRRLRAAFADAVAGRDRRFAHWLDPVAA
jgi:branched-chain amino acid aminotransferase